jgi:hypothetical protein
MPKKCGSLKKATIKKQTGIILFSTKIKVGEGL